MTTGGYVPLDEGLQPFFDSLRRSNRQAYDALLTHAVALVAPGVVGTADQMLDARDKRHFGIAARIAARVWTLDHHQEH